MMYGFRNCLNVSLKTAATARAIPITEPIRQPSIASWKVTHKWYQTFPCVTYIFHIDAAISVGLGSNKGLLNPVLLAISHINMTTKKISVCLITAPPKDPVYWEFSSILLTLAS